MTLIKRFKTKLKKWFSQTASPAPSQQKSNNQILSAFGDERAHKHVMEIHGAICQIWDRGWELAEADCSAQAPSHPTCMWSPNGDGRFNFSYAGSLFYTVDKHGVVECEQAPDESDYNLNDLRSFFLLARMVLADIAPEETQESMTKATKELLGKALGVMNAIR